MGIDQIVRERRLLTHPFYQKWQNGKVTIETLKEYAKQYYHYEKALPSFLESTLEHMGDGPAREAVATVLADELSNPRPHSELWIEFAEGLGLTGGDVKDAEASPRTTNLVETYTSLCRRGVEEGLAAIYSYESQFAEVARAKADGLRSFYGVSDEDSLRFFDLHTALDVEHAKLIRSGFADGELSRESARLAIEAWWGMLDQFNEEALVTA